MRNTLNRISRWLLGAVAMFWSVLLCSYLLVGFPTGPIGYLAHVMLDLEQLTQMTTDEEVTRAVAIWALPYTLGPLLCLLILFATQPVRADG